MFDSKEYEAALLEFLQLIESLGQPKWLLAEHLRTPAAEHAPLAGSTLGRSVWEHDSGKRLIGSLLRDDDLHAWFDPAIGGPTPETRLDELRAHIASLISEWGQREMAAEEVAGEWAELFLDAVKNPQPSCAYLRVLFGVGADRRVDLPGGVGIEPATPENFRKLVAGYGGPERDILRMPSRPALLVLTNAQVGREEFGSFAATTAFAGADILAENARWDIWLTTGVLPRLGDSYVVGNPSFPVMSPERFPASWRETHARALSTESPLLDAELLVSIHHRMEALRNQQDHFPLELTTPLWVANSFIHSAIDVSDDLVTLVLAHAAVDGLLLHMRDPKSRFVPRLARLVQRDVEDGRSLRRVAKKWTELRDHGAHGEYPESAIVDSFLERTPSEEDWILFRTGDPKIWNAAGRRAANILRRVFLGMLYCCIAVDDEDSLQPGLSRDEVVEVLERADSGDTLAKEEIAARVPQFVRDIKL